MNILPKIVVLTGAGISAESGIKTFRAEDGLWEEHNVEDVATPRGFRKNPNLVQTFYNERRKHLFNPKVKPNKAHIALANFEKKYIANNQANDFLLVTQNIDNLHQRAGSKNVMPMHGELLKVRCFNTNKVYSWEKDVLTNDVCDCCKQQNLRPHIVWFEEMPLYMNEIINELQKTAYFIAIGTSGNVYPAAGFVMEANMAGAHSVELNLEPSLTNTKFKQQIYGKATEIVPNYFENLYNQLIK